MHLHVQVPIYNADDTDRDNLVQKWAKIDVHQVLGLGLGLGLKLGLGLALGLGLRLRLGVRSGVRL